MGLFGPFVTVICALLAVGWGVLLYGSPPVETAPPAPPEPAEPAPWWRP